MTTDATKKRINKVTKKTNTHHVFIRSILQDFGLLFKTVNGITGRGFYKQIYFGDLFHRTCIVMGNKE